MVKYIPTFSHNNLIASRCLTCEAIRDVSQQGHVCIFVNSRANLLQHYVDLGHSGRTSLRYRKEKKENTPGSSGKIIQIPYASCYLKEKSHKFPSDNHTEISQANKNFQGHINGNMHDDFHL